MACAPRGLPGALIVGLPEGGGADLDKDKNKVCRVGISGIKGGYFAVMGPTVGRYPSPEVTERHRYFFAIQRLATTDDMYR